MPSQLVVAVVVVQVFLAVAVVLLGAGLLLQLLALSVQVVMVAQAVIHAMETLLQAVVVVTMSRQYLAVAELLHWLVQQIIGVFQVAL
jgi:hypothetical protein